MTSRWPLLGISVVLCAGLVACDSTQPQSTPESSSDSEQADAEPVEWTPCPDDYLVRDPARSFDGDDVDCSAIVVPAVYEAPSDLPGFQIAMMRLPSTGPAKDSPTLFINPGGPGGSGIEELQEQDIPDAIRKNYDVVGFDPRGVLHSQPVEGNPSAARTRSTSRRTGTPRARQTTRNRLTKHSEWPTSTTTTVRATIRVGGL
jgi:pimeloyl-ACP methyl ester carboxylesterase